MKLRHLISVLVGVLIASVFVFFYEVWDADFMSRFAEAWFGDYFVFYDYYIADWSPPLPLKVAFWVAVVIVVLKIYHNMTRR